MEVTEFMEAKREAQRMADEAGEPVRICRAVNGGKLGAFMLNLKSEDRPAGMHIETVAPASPAAVTSPRPAACQDAPAFKAEKWTGMQWSLIHAGDDYADYWQHVGDARREGAQLQLTENKRVYRIPAL